MQKLHSSISKLIAQSEVLTPNEIAFISVYLPESKDLFSGLLEAVKYRLAHRNTPIVLFSFHNKEFLQQYDTFGIVSLSGTAFVQLPFAKQELENAINTATSISETDWKSFSENACKTLLQQRMLELMHGNKFPLGNKALNPLRMLCSAIVSSPQLKEQFLQLLPEKFEALRSYITIPEVKELLQWCLVCNNSADVYLQFAYSFSLRLQQLAEHTADTDANEIISLIDSVNKSFDQIKQQ